MRMLQRKQPLNRFRQRTRVRLSTIVISALVLNLFFLTYAYMNLGVPKTASASASLNLEDMSGLMIYPNPIPAGSSATIEIPSTESEIEVSIMDIEGKQIFSKSFDMENNSGTISFQTEAFPSKGTFYLVVASSKTQTIKEIFVE